jgi:glucose-6-phosphate 1-dehydrogenase
MNGSNRVARRETTSIVIMGATGDLAKRKLMPALFHLWCKERLSPATNIIGFSRSEMSDEEFREFMWRGINDIGGLALQRREWDGFAPRLYYVPGDLTNPDHLERLEQKLGYLEHDKERANRLFYLSIAPSLYESAVRNLGAIGLVDEERHGWRRVVIEKPFGHDLASAQELDKAIHKVFSESQVFRIDHYMGKETVQNLLAFRFGNAIFEPIWNRNYVDNVQITVAEKVDVGERAGYYDQFGVVRDMIQNHLLQVLCMVAMEPPFTLGTDSLRTKKVEVLQAIRKWDPDEAARNAVRAQYRGYRRAKGVDPHSTTPTYVAMRLFIDNWRWQGVPFYLRSGKSLSRKSSEVAIEFRMPPHSIFPRKRKQEMPANILSLRLQPDEGVHLRFNTKVPDQGMTLQPVDMEFHYKDVFGGEELPEAYEVLLEDALEGDASLFIRSDHIDEAWRVVDPFLHAWEDHAAHPLHIYEPGSWGPESAEALLEQDGRTWTPLFGAHDGFQD